MDENTSAILDLRRAQKDQERAWQEAKAELKHTWEQYRDELEENRRRADYIEEKAEKRHLDLLQALKEIEKPNGRENASGGDDELSFEQVRAQ